MASKGRGYNSKHEDEWDMKEDFNNILYDSQYPDDDSSAGVQLDHTRLYITNLPKMLTEKGLKDAFSRYGTLEEAYLSKDPIKRHALVKYETAGEARVAMMKMNKIEPFNWNISIAHKSKVKTHASRPDTSRISSSYKETNRVSNNNNSFKEHVQKDRSGSVSSKSRVSRSQEEQTNGDEPKESVEEDLGLTLDTSLHMELEMLKLEKLKIKEAQLNTKERLLLLQQNENKKMQNNTSRSILPDGRIVVQNTDKFNETEDSFCAGAGDSCVVCGGDGGLYCGACGITPYCSVGCQRKDWAVRHKAVCHNLNKMTNKPHSKQPPVEIETTSPPVGPLRRPYVKREGSQHSDRSTHSDEHHKSLMIPPGQKQEALELFRQKEQTRINTRNFNGPKKDMRRPNIKRNEHYDDIDAGKPAPKETPKPFEPKPEPMKPAETRASKGFEPEKPVASTFKNEPVNNVANVIRSKEEAKPAPIVLTPKECLIHKLSVGDIFMVSVEKAASECATKQAGFVCLTLNEEYQPDYSRLCNEYGVECEKIAGQFVPKPGVLFSYYDSEDSGWYRARCLSKTQAALIDANRTVTLSEADKCRTVPSAYEQVIEFCAVINAKGIQVGGNYKCSVLSSTEEGLKVTVAVTDSDEFMSEGNITRWMPEIQTEIISAVASRPNASVSASDGQSSFIPSVPRPALRNNGRYILLDATGLSRACVRPLEATAVSDGVLHDVILYGRNASPLKEPPAMGQVVIAKFNDGLHYRALVKRTNIKSNRYLIEYVEYGNDDIASLEDLYLCPPELDLNSSPAQASLIQLSTKQPSNLTDAAKKYVDQIKEELEMILTIPSGASSAPSNSLAHLTLVKNNESVNKKLEDLCTPEWKKLEERGGDVLELPKVMYPELQMLGLPTDRSFTLKIIQASDLEFGCICGYEAGDPGIKKVLNELTDNINAYCASELCKEPYLPNHEELCITKYPPKGQWYRAVFLEHIPGPGGRIGRVLFIDQGNMANVPIADIRKILPEFVHNYPGLANQIEIKGLPSQITEEQKQLAWKLLKLDKDGCGTIQVNKCYKTEEDSYVIDLPEIVKAVLEI